MTIQELRNSDEYIHDIYTAMNHSYETYTNINTVSVQKNVRKNIHLVRSFCRSELFPLWSITNP